MSTALTLVLLTFHPTQTSPADAAPNESTTVTELVQRLHSPRHDERHRATLALKAMDRSILDELQAAYVANPDLEVRARLQSAAEGILFREALEGMGGFMGIGLQNVPANRDPQLPPDQRAIRVTRVMPDTGAEAAGMKKGDLIVELNGELLVSDGTQQQFMEEIRIRPPGEVIFMTILRDGETIYKDVVLGLRPANLVDDRGATEQRELLDKATRDFAEWHRGIKTRPTSPK